MTKPENTNEADEGQSALNVGLGIADSLRHKTCGEISCDQCNEERAAAAEEIDRLREALIPLANAGFPDERARLTDEDVARAQAALYGA